MVSYALQIAEPDERPIGYYDMFGSAAFSTAGGGAFSERGNNRHLFSGTNKVQHESEDEKLAAACRGGFSRFFSGVGGYSVFDKLAEFFGRGVSMERVAETMRNSLERMRSQHGVDYDDETRAALDRIIEENDLELPEITLTEQDVPRADEIISARLAQSNPALFANTSLANPCCEPEEDEAALCEADALSGALVIRLVERQGVNLEAPSPQPAPATSAPTYTVH